MIMTAATQQLSNEKPSLLSRLLVQGNHVSIEQGVLKITPRSGKPVPNKWFKDHSPQVVREICQENNIDAYRYSNFSTGSYSVEGSNGTTKGSNGKKSGGVSLVFHNVITGKAAFMVFNANLKRVRTTRTGKKGSSLPGNQFSISERSVLYKLWLSTGLALPPSLSKFYECMGGLKSFVFVGEINDDNKITNSTAQLLTVAGAVKHRPPINSTIKQSDESKQSIVVVNHKKHPNDQTVDEWLTEYSAS